MPTILSEKLDGNVGSRRKGDQLTIEQDWHFLIKADSPHQDRMVILHQTPGVPQYNVAYGAYGMMLDSADGDRLNEDPLLWNCVYHLSNIVPEGNDRNPSTGDQQTGDPSGWVPQIEIAFDEQDEVLREALAFTDAQKHNDVGGTDPFGYTHRAWQNSAGTPFDTAFIRRVRIPIRQFTQFEKFSGTGARTIDDILGWHDTLNDDTFLGKRKRTLKLTVDKVAIGTYYSYRCWRVDMSLHFNKRDWRLKQLDLGWMHRNPDDLEGDLIPFMKKGQPYLGKLDLHGLPYENVFDDAPNIMYLKEFEDAHFQDFLRVTM